MVHLIDIMFRKAVVCKVLELNQVINKHLGSSVSACCTFYQRNMRLNHLNFMNCKCVDAFPLQAACLRKLCHVHRLRREDVPLC